MDSTINTQIAVGIDGGGTSTRVLAESYTEDTDSKGHIVFRGQSGSSNLLTTGRNTLRAHLAKATENCPEPEVVCGCFAGLILNKHRILATELLRNIFPDAQIFVEPDYTAALFASDPLADVTVISGTGSMVCSYDGATVHKSGGGGFLLGDVGSGYSIGRAAVSLYVSGQIELSEPLEAALVSHFGTVEPSEITSKLYTEPGPQRKLARMGTPVGELATLEMDWAQNLIHEAMSGLAVLTANHIESHVLPTHAGGPIRVSLAGGLWKGSSFFTSSYRIALANCLNQRESLRRASANEVLCEIELLRKPPVAGAVRLAKARKLQGSPSSP